MNILLKRKSMKQTPKKIGLTGGIGTGKTTVAKIFLSLQIPVYNSDNESKRILNTNPQIKKTLTENFGKEIYQTNGKINKQAFAKIIFSNTQALDIANQIIWREVRNDFNMWCEKQTAPYVIQESALLYESGATSRYNAMIVVDAPWEMRINRTMQRDGLSREQILQRMKNQIPQEQKNKMADFIVINDETKMLIPQILEIHKKIKNTI